MPDSAMNPLAITATPPPTVSHTEAANAAIPAGKNFDDTLKQAQPAVKSRTQEHDDDHGTGAHKGAKTAARKQDDEHKHDDASSPSSTPAAAMIAPAQARQPLAVHGKTSPADDGKPAGAIASSVAAQDIAAAVATAAPPAAQLGPATTPIMSRLPLSAQPVHIPAPLVSVKDIAGVAPAPTAQMEGATSSNAPAGESGASASTTSPNANLQTILQAAAQSGDAHTGADGKDSGLAPNSEANGFIAHLAQLAAGTHAGATATQAPPPTQLMMQSMPGQPQFVQEAAQHVAWLAGQDIQRAEIQLNPRKLGPIQVEITTHHDHVDVSFAVQHPQTVHALQQTLPQLTDMLAQQGLNLGNASVGQQAAGQQHQAFAQHAETGNAIGNIDGGEPEPTSGWRTLRLAPTGSVDDFA